MIEKEHTLSILKKAKKALKTRNAILLREISNQTIHSASIYKDPDAVMLAVTTYALSKILERENYRNYPEWKPFLKSCIYYIERAINSLKKEDIDSFRENMISIRRETEKITSKLKEYILDVFRKASINKASRIYEHGISREETARLLGITEWELSEYVGATGIADVDLSITKPILERLKFAKDLFE